MSTAPPMDDALVTAARDTIGFMPEPEGLALYDAAMSAGAPGPLLEIGSYCGKSAIFLGAAARARDTVLYSIDHHRGSAEQQPGHEYFDPRLVDAEGKIDTLPVFLVTIARARLTDVVLPIVGDSTEVAGRWSEPVALVFVDGSHDEQAVATDVRAWTPHLAAGGSLAIHDVFEDPAEGGQGPFLAYRAALSSGAFAELSSEGSLRVLRKLDRGF